MVVSKIFPIFYVASQVRPCFPGAGDASDSFWMSRCKARDGATPRYAYSGSAGCPISGQPCAVAARSPA